MDSIGSTLNKRYRLDRKIGEGGFASVFLATDLDLGRQVAIKVLEQEWTRDKDLLTRFRNEARAIAALDHPNILQIYDFGVTRDAPYLVMPYISGGTLGDRMKRERLTLDEIGFYLDQIGSALDYAHQRGIVHRDIKPANLLIRSNGQLALMDFGLAKLLENASAEAATAIVGTVAYMAPEQCRGMVSAASDIYMLGVILYQMLAGKLPYEGNTMQVLAGLLHTTHASLVGQPTMRSVPLAVVQALDQVLLKVLAKVPADRYPTCQALSLAYYQALQVDPNRAAKYRKGVGSSPQWQAPPDATLMDPPGLVPARGSATPAPGSLDATLMDPPSSPVQVSPTPAPGSLGATLLDPPSSAPARVSPTPAPGSLEATLLDPPSSAPARVSPTPAPGSLNAREVAPHSPQRKKVLLKPPRLLVTTEPDQGFRATFNLMGETLSLGRATDNNLRVPLMIVSRYHAVLTRLSGELEEPAYKITQYKSVNPLLFKGKKVTEKVLEHGDIIEIGERGYADYIVKLRYEAPEYGFV